jgi:hypothetical protein
MSTEKRPFLVTKSYQVYLRVLCKTYWNIGTNQVNQRLTEKNLEHGMKLGFSKLEHGNYPVMTRFTWLNEQYAERPVPSPASIEPP